MNKNESEDVDKIEDKSARVPSWLTNATMDMSSRIESGTIKAARKGGLFNHGI